ncbi:flavin-containing monooxygenase 5-like [Styela clava]
MCDAEQEQVRGSGLMKVAVIGSGASGLTAIKTCLDEGITPVCFEEHDNIGGVWNYVHTTKNSGSIYKSTVANSSKEMMGFSDFPVPKEFPNFMHHSKIQEYFNLYAERFQLRQHIRFFTRVVSCTTSSGFDNNGQWKVTQEDVKTGKKTIEIYDGVLVCVGRHAVPYFPLEDFKGMENFEGKYIHSRDYRDPTGYENLNVVVVGIGNSGVDIAVDLCRQSKQVYLSTRRGAWIFRRIDNHGLPSELQFARKFVTDVRKIIPRVLFQYIGKKVVANHFDHEKYGLLPDHPVFAQCCCINDDIADRMSTGSIQVSVIFEDGTEENIDAAIFATGYSVEYPFLKSILQVEENRCDLFKYVWPPHLKKHTLAIIGAIQPLGAVNPISEIQCRWTTKVFKGELGLPSEEEMKKDIRKIREALANNYVKSKRHETLVNYQPYMDEIADIISCKPKYLKYFITDPYLAFKVYFGPAVPSMYRLEGPGRWSEARKTIMTVDDRILFPLKKRMTKSIGSHTKFYLVLDIILFGIVAMIISYLWAT